MTIIAIPKDERLAGYYAALKYAHITSEVPVGEVILMVNAILRAAYKVRKERTRRKRK